MATHDYVIDNSTGANVRADLNLVLQAILSNNSSSSAPSTTAAYMWWADTTNGILKIRNSANNAWVELLQLDGTLTLEDGSASTPGLAFRDDLNTGIFSSAADTFNVATGGVERMELGATTIFNEDGADVDFRIEGDTQANLFYVDAGNDRVGIRTNSPESVLDVRGIDDQDNFKVEVADTIFAVHTDASTGEISLRASDGSSSNFAKFMSFHTETASVGSSAERMRIDSSGRVLIGATTEGNESADELTIGSSGNTGITLRSGTSGNTSLFFSDATSGAAEYAGSVQYRHASDVMTFGTASTERMRIDSSGRVAIQGSPTRALLDVRASGGSNTMLTAVFGANEGTTAGTLSDNADKGGRVGLYHYDLDEEPFGLFSYGASNGTNALNFGGGTSLMNAATHIGFYTATNSTTTGGSERMRITSTGNIGMGTTSPTSYDSSVDDLVIQGSGNTGITIATTNTGSNTTLVFSDGTGDADSKFRGGVQYIHNGDIMRFLVSSAEKVRITNEAVGQVFVGCTAEPLSGISGIMIQGNGVQAIGYAGTGSSNMIEFNNANGRIGQITGNGSNTAYHTSSDYRLKENASSISDGITRLKTLKPYRFNFKTEPSVTQDGFFAHEVFSVVPQAVVGNKDATKKDGSIDPQGLDHSKLVPLLVAAVQELITKVEILEAA